jgi:hypothetical protein
MKKTLILAALLSAAVAMPAVPAVAADTAAATVDGKCYVLPLLPDCAAQWNDYWAAKGYHISPLPVAWWTCERAEEGSGHLLDCETDA